MSKESNGPRFLAVFRLETLFILGEKKGAKFRNHSPMRTEDKEIWKSCEIPAGSFSKLMPVREPRTSGRVKQVQKYSFIVAFGNNCNSSL